MNFCWASSLSVVWRSGCHFRAYKQSMSDPALTSVDWTYQSLVRYSDVFNTGIIGIEIKDLKILGFRYGYRHIEYKSKRR